MAIEQTEEQGKGIAGDGLESAGRALAARVHSGDASAEDELCRQFERGLLSILRRAVGDPELARELCQETLVVVLRRLRSGPLDDPGRLAAFAAQTARNLAIAERRKAARRNTSPDSPALEEQPDPARPHSEIEEANSSAIAVRRLLQELHSDRDRAVLIRFYLDEEDRSSICRDLGLTDTLFHQVIFRARTRLRELLQKQGLSRSDFFCLCVA